MAGYELVENIKATQQEVFYFLVNVENAPAVIANIRKSEKLEDGPLGMGSHYKQSRSHNGQEHEMIVEVTGFDAPNIYSVESKKKGIRAVYRYKLQPSRMGTEIRLKAEVHAKGAKRAVAWVVARVMQGKDRDMLANMKAAMEGGEKKEGN